MTEASLTVPLAERMRPRQLDEVLGQPELLGEGKPLRRALAAGKPHSMIFWGPPGTGKTTLARLVAGHCDCHFIALSAVLGGVKEVRSAVAEASERREMMQQQTLLFVDEVHRFNKAQQDAFLPHVEDGTVIFIGATTENPSFEVNNALLSRARVYRLQALTAEPLKALLLRALNDSERGLGGQKLQTDAAGLDLLVQAADGDARRALTLLEVVGAALGAGAVLDGQTLPTVLGASLRRFDKGGEAFYDQISALHKSIRGSAVDASLYWLARMLDGGCEPMYLARRLLRMASEDIGNADPRALQVCSDAASAYERLGSPEGELALAQAVAYLAAAPKSNAVYTAFKAVQAEVQRSGSLEVPLHLRNAPTKLMAASGYGQGYRYAHDEPEAYAAGVEYLPEALTGRQWYFPVERGLEIKIAAKLRHLAELDAAAHG